jgi:hypothetical protein
MWEETNANYGLFSLSEVSDHALMWSHYADSHKGICLQLMLHTAHPPYQVSYSNARPQFLYQDVKESTRDYERFARTVMSTLTTKAAYWAYEKEWRCIQTDGPGERPMYEMDLTGIIFGCRTSDQDMETVREWVESAGPPCRFYRAKQREGGFALDIVEIQSHTMPLDSAAAR